MKKYFLALLVIFVVFSFSSCASVPSPQITEAEFPFEIVYEIDGETVTVSDVYVCEFDGIEWNENAGKHRQWKGYVKSTGDNDLVLAEDGNVKVVCDLGAPAYYMDDPSMEAAGEVVPTVYCVTTFASGGVSSVTLDDTTLLEQYRIKLVSWSFSLPIENSFE